MASTYTVQRAGEIISQQYGQDTGRRFLDSFANPQEVIGFDQLMTALQPLVDPLPQPPDPVLRRSNSSSIEVELNHKP